jgi:hypothetical protein
LIDFSRDKLGLQASKTSAKTDTEQLEEACNDLKDSIRRAHSDDEINPDAWMTRVR